MSAAQIQTTLESLQCHFTWNLDCSRKYLLRLRHKMEDFSTEEGNRWLGHIYNLWGFIEYKLGLNEEAKSLFQKAGETLNQLREADEGPWLVVNYGNLAWLHHYLGDEAESQEYLSKVDALMREYPSPSRDPEIYAEQAWTLIFTEDQNQVFEYFERAASMQPDMVDWNTSYVIWLKKAQHFSEPRQVPDLLEKMRQAKERDPKNLNLAVLYLEQRADEGGNIKEEVRELAGNLSAGALHLSNSGMWVLLNLYRNQTSADEAVDLAERVLREHPDVRYLKKFAAQCYRWRIIYFSRSLPDPEQSTVDRAIALHEELLSLYPHALLKREIDLATVCAKSHHRNHEAEQMFRRLLENEPAEPADKQMLYNMYATHLFHDQNDRHRSTQYHMKAAAIPETSNHRENSIRILEETRDRGRGRMCRKIDEFLRNLPEPGQ